MHRARLTKLFPVSIALLALLGASPPGCPPLATPPPSTALDEPGPYEVASYDYFYSTSFGLVQSTITYPASSDEAPYPAVVMAPGYCAIAGWQTWVGKHLASHGYVVLTFTDPTFCSSTQYGQDVGMEAGFEVLASEGSTSGRPIFGRVDLARRATIGHSMGAGTAAKVSTTDGAVRAAVMMGGGGLGEPLVSEISVPLLLMAGDLDCQAGYLDDLTTYDVLAGVPKQVVVIAGANHSGFTDEGSLGDVLGPALGDCPRTIEVEDHQHRLARRYFTAWLDHFVKGEDDSLGYLGGAGAQADLASGSLSHLRTNLGG